MIKPDWREAPEWAKYVAQDRNGEWFWYSDEPERGDDQWLSPYGCRYKAAEAIEIRWLYTLEPRP